MGAKSGAGRIMEGFALWFVDLSEDMAIFRTLTAVLLQCRYSRYELRFVRRSLPTKKNSRIASKLA